MKKTTQPSMTLTRLIGRFDSEDACKTFLRDLSLAEWRPLLSL